MDTSFIKDVLVKHDEIITFCQQAAEMIESSYEPNESFILLCVLKGSVPFTAELLKNFTRSDVKCDFIRASSYTGATTESRGTVGITCNTLENIKGENIVLVEDIIDTGYTLQALKDYLASEGAKSVKTIALLDKKERREVNIEADYVGFSIPNHFVVGFGLDYNEKYRNLQDIVIPYVEKL